MQSKTLYRNLDLITLDIFLETPGYVFWKDINSVYMGCNKNGAVLYGVNSPDDIIGKTDYDFQQKFAKIFVEQDKYVMETGRSYISENDIITTEEKNIILRTEKKPLYDNDMNIIGVIGVAIDVTAEQENNILQVENERYKIRSEEEQKVVKFVEDMLHNFQSFKMEMLNNKIGAKPKLPNITREIKLTKREREIVYFLSLNKSPKEIAHILSIIENKSLSPLTISSIIDKQLYVKFEVNSISKLIEVANKMKLVPFLIS